MILTGKQIRERIRNGIEIFEKDKFDKKLIITPLLDNLSSLKDDSVSIDLRLGTKFKVFNKAVSSHIDPLSVDFYKRQSVINAEIWLGEKIILHPNQFILGETLEWVRMPADLAGLLTAKSSQARDGLQVESANLIHPRFSGTITLELKNNGEIPITLYPGLTYSQLSFLSCSDDISDIHSPISKSNFPYSFEPNVSTKHHRDIDILKRINPNLNINY